MPKTEREKMVAGELYDPLDPELVAERRRARLLLKAFNDSSPDDEKERLQLIRKIFPGTEGEVFIEPPFHCDYGNNIILGDKVYFNFNCIILDVAPVVIGSRVMFGPGVHIYTATHPLNAIERSSGREFGETVTIGDDVWIGGGAIVCPGVSIGPRSVIGAGSVVTRDIPPLVLAAGNPCRVIRQIG